jgi:TonB family protein
MAVSDPANPMSSPAHIVRGPQEFGFEADFADLAARFAAKSGGGLSAELSAELALEIVLNEIVEQACQITGATGAAIVLDRDGELICRAASGSTAPELGLRIDPSVGLHGECFRSSKTLWCDDTFTDSRAANDPLKQLGIRSVVVMPLLRGETLVGIFSLFSTEPYAFGVRDERTLEILADRTVNNLDHVSQPFDSQPELINAATDRQEEDLQKIGVQDVTSVDAAVHGLAAPNEGASEKDSAPGIVADLPAPSLNAAKNAVSDASGAEATPVASTGAEFDSDFPDFDPAEITPEEIHALLKNAGVITSDTELISKDVVPEEKPTPVPLLSRPELVPAALAPPKHADYVSWALGFAIVSVAVLLGLVLGQHFVLNHRSAPLRAASAAQPASTPTRTTSAPSQAQTSAIAKAATERSDATANTSRPAHTSASHDSPANASAAFPPGGLVVSQNGKEVFRLGPGDQPDNQQTPSAEQVVQPASEVQSDSNSQPVVNLPEATAQRELVHRVEPEYPEAAREQNIQGPVVLEVRIGTSGSVENVNVVSGVSLLAQASVDAVKQWKFRPRVANGHPVQMQTRVTFNFELPQ